MANKATLEIVAVADGGARASISTPSSDPRGFDPAQATREAARADAIAKAFAAAIDKQKQLDPAKFENIEGVKFTKQFGKKKYKLSYGKEDEEAGTPPTPTPPTSKDFLDKIFGNFKDLGDSLKKMTGGGFLGNLLTNVTDKAKASFDKEGMLKQGAEGRFSPKNLLSDVGGAVGGAVGSLFGPAGAAIGMAVGKFVPGLLAAVGAVKLFTSGIAKASEAALQFSAQAIQAKAQGEVELIQNSFKIAQESGGAVADVTRAQTSFEKQFQDFGSVTYQAFAPTMEVFLYLGEKILAAITYILERILVLQNYIEGVVEFLSSWAADNLAWIPGVGSLMKKFDAWMKSDNDSKTQDFGMQDTVDDIFGIKRLSERRRG